MFVVIYLWQGQRMRENVYRSRAAANAAVLAFRANGWQAWAEPLNGGR